jgi:hypothetical protein
MHMTVNTAFNAVFIANNPLLRIKKNMLRCILNTEFEHNIVRDIRARSLLTFSFELFFNNYHYRSFSLCTKIKARAFTL